jgi:ParB family transcriptional regulator, chromosome partitioning protein
MADKKVGLGRGIGALIPSAPANVDRSTGDSSNADRSANDRPIDVFFGAGAGPGSAEANLAAASQASADASSQLVAVPGARMAHLEVNSIKPNPSQPRKVFEDEPFQELVHSIKEFGVFQAIVVRPLGEENGEPTYELIMGERRLRASKKAGLTHIPAVIRETSDENMLRDALLENIHRANLNVLEEASAYQQLLSDFGITQDQLAEKIGRSRPQITNTIRLLKLPVSVQLKVASGVLSAGHARAILSAPTEERMEYFANKVINEGLSVRSLEEIVAVDKPAKPGKATITQGGRKDGLKEISEQLGDKLDTKVSIVLGKKKGQLIIDFATYGDLTRILRELGFEKTN